MKNRRGFTLLELLIVMAIVTIIAAMLLPIGIAAGSNVKAALSAPVTIP